MSSRDRLDKTDENYIQQTISIADRIRYLISRANITQGRFAQRIGMDAANFSKVMSGVLKMSDTFVNRVVVELGVSKRWLLTGEGIPFEKTPQKDVDSIMADVILDTTLNKKGAPIYDIDVTAGFSELSHELTNERIVGYLDFPKVHPRSIVVKVSGDSMVPVIDDGAYIAIHEVPVDGIIAWGNIYVLVLEDYRLVKYVRKNPDPTKVTLVSANKEFDDMTVPLDKIYKLFHVDAILNYRLQ